MFYKYVMLYLFADLLFRRAFLMQGIRVKQPGKKQASVRLRFDVCPHLIHGKYCNFTALYAIKKISRAAFLKG